MFRVFKRKKNNTSEPIVELVIDTPVYEQLKKHALIEGISENEELLRALRRGMRDYWLHVAKYERERYQLVERLFEQSKRDSELLEAIINQNVRFHEILEDEEKQREIHGRKQ
jgi:hypothetical protein